MIITSHCPHPQKQKQAKIMTATTQTGKHTSTKRPTIARNKSNKKREKDKTNKKINKTIITIITTIIIK